MLSLPNGMLTSPSQPSCKFFICPNQPDITYSYKNCPDLWITSSAFSGCEAMSGLSLHNASVNSFSTNTSVNIPSTNHSVHISILHYHFPAKVCHNIPFMNLIQVIPGKLVNYKIFYCVKFVEGHF